MSPQCRKSDSARSSTIRSIRGELRCGRFGHEALAGTAIGAQHLDVRQHPRLKTHEPTGVRRGGQVRDAEKAAAPAIGRLDATGRRGRCRRGMLQHGVRWNSAVKQFEHCLRIDAAVYHSGPLGLVHDLARQRVAGMQCEVGWTQQAGRGGQARPEAAGPLRTRALNCFHEKLLSRGYRGCRTNDAPPHGHRGFASAVPPAGSGGAGVHKAKSPVPGQRGLVPKWQKGVQPCSSFSTVCGDWLACASMAVAACEMICVRASSLLALA